MDIAYISAISALAGSVVGGMTSGLTTWLGGRSQARAGRLVAELTRRQELFKDFIVAASNTYSNALVASDPQNIQEVVALWAMVSRMRVLCLPRTTASAEKVMRQTIDSFFAPPKTPVELRDLLIKGGIGIDPLLEFSEAAREELNALAAL
jgi:hypothetical protein